jgi:hypothetical protein
MSSDKEELCIVNVNVHKESDYIEMMDCTEQVTTELHQSSTTGEENNLNAVHEASPSGNLPSVMDVEQQVDNSHAEVSASKPETSIEEYINPQGSKLSQGEKKTLMNKGTRHVFVEIGEGYHPYHRFQTNSEQNEVAFYNYDMYECAYDQTAYRLLWDISASEGHYLVESMSMVVFNQLKLNNKVWIRGGWWCAPFHVFWC